MSEIITSVGTVDDLHESAMRRTGLSDFGDPSDGYREALQVLLDSYREEAALTELGSKLSRVFLRGALSARLISEAAFAAARGDEQRQHERLGQPDGGEGVLVLTDLYGASPSNLAAQLARLGTPVRRVAGLSLPMLLRVMNYADLPLDALPAVAAAGARNGAITDDA